jgi:hypothetical protein
MCAAVATSLRNTTLREEWPYLLGENSASRAQDFVVSDPQKSARRFKFPQFINEISIQRFNFLSWLLPANFFCTDTDLPLEKDFICTIPLSPFCWRIPFPLFLHHSPARGISFPLFHKLNDGRHIWAHVIMSVARQRNNNVFLVGVTSLFQDGLEYFTLKIIL